MQLGYIIVYVPDVPVTLSFYETAFGMKRKFLHNSQTYGELDTSTTTLAFAQEDMRALNGVETADNRPHHKAPGIEIAFVTEDVYHSYEHAVTSGAIAVQEPKEKPWGQTVAYVRDINGILIELCTQIAN